MTKTQNKEELLEEIAKLEIKRADLFKKKEPIDRMLIQSAKEIERIRGKISSITLAQPMTRAEQIVYFLSDAAQSDGVKDQAATKFWDDQGIMTSGYVVDTLQMSLMIAMTYNDEVCLQKHLKILSEVLPYIQETKKGYKFLSILEHSLSINGSYSLHVYADRYEVAHGRWLQKKCNTLEEALRYIQMYHWYDGKDDRDEDDY